MTQPAVSLAIRELEAYYGVKLFDRIGRRLQITEGGQRLLQYASHISSMLHSRALHIFIRTSILTT